MIANKFITIAGLAAAVAVVAQDPTSSGPTSIPTENIPPCTLQCVTSAAGTGGCASFTDIPCICTSQEFQQAALQCLQSTCNAQEQQAALAVHVSQCGAPFRSASSSSTTTGPSGTSGSGYGSGSSPSTTTNAASTTKVAFTSSGFIAIVWLWPVLLSV
ncbi:gpi anchored cfem domain protein [Moniliophthora roreri MCA 2997]|uniref:Gpi anchored cfem domain protein n=1 Tax=Moniliophthora roreri (strain MCA 2997) TaxID=1381753 RepID=V2XA77_MONRO|nr:gpi anchored cfem domain protein [Moniliophthora roreri MCA 2997]KAI3596372.1 gpi anchored cfem domain protein [Moniliophthora roreri]